MKTSVAAQWINIDQRIKDGDLHDPSNDRCSEESIHCEHAPSPSCVDVQGDHRDMVVVKVDATEYGKLLEIAGETQHFSAG